MFTEFSDPFHAPEMMLAREALRTWRFYDTFRVDVDSPARSPSIATSTPVLRGDGSDLAAAMQTIREIGDNIALDCAIRDAFPDTTLTIEPWKGYLHLTLSQAGLRRDLTAQEVSDGTLRYLLLIAALLTPRPPQLIVLNEPENSLHPDLIPALGRLIKSAAKRTQMIVVSHSEKLVTEMAEDDICVAIRLEKEASETVLHGGDLLSQQGWKWPSR
jgi:predicted ATPase